MIDSKVQPPRLSRTALERSRLFDQLDARPETAVVVVRGGAGLGKTTLVRQWTSRLDTSWRLAWLTVDSRDNDADRLLRYLAAALDHACPELGWQPPPGSSPDSVVDDLLGLLARTCAPLVVVLDDVHFLVDPSAVRLLEALTDVTSDRVRLVLVSRVRPAVRLARRAAVGDVAEITAEQLLFTPEETASVVRAAVPDVASGSRDLVARLHEVTGGWPVAVALTTRLAGRDGLESAADPRHGGRELSAYLTEEVLLAQTPEWQEFLLDTSEQVPLPL